MKLYTEEQLIKYLLDVGIMELFDLENNLVPHIELPSDEEIREQGKTQSTFAPSFIYGAEWMRDKIQGGNK
jgi:hypothetical protein